MKTIIFLFVLTMSFIKAQSNIQDLINNAQPGDTIIIESGNYNENLHITKPITLTAALHDTVRLYNTSDTLPTIFINSNNVYLNNNI